MTSGGEKRDCIGAGNVICQHPAVLGAARSGIGDA
jgi:hypothetical protein